MPIWSALLIYFFSFSWELVFISLANSPKSKSKLFCIVHLTSQLSQQLIWKVLSLFRKSIYCLTKSVNATAIVLSSIIKIYINVYSLKVHILSYIW